jgi:fumarylacetoacetase
MPAPIDQTHDPKLESWVESANDPSTDFPIQNLPLCQVDGPGLGVSGEIGVRIGDSVLLVRPLADAALVEDLMWVCNSIQDVAPGYVYRRGTVRDQLIALLRKDNPTLRDNSTLRGRALVPISEVELLNPCQLTRDYTDFYASIYHATNVGSMFRPDNPLLPNYKHIPIGYHGRASSIVPSGTPIRRPNGQQAPATDDGSPTFGPCRMLDYEMELGAVIARGNTLGHPIPIADAEDHILGLCILNDWSARDLQKWEYVPLGPFLAKNFASTVSPFIVTMEALAPFRCPAFDRPAGDPQPLPYMNSPANRAAGGFDITLEVHLATAQMRDNGIAPVRLSKGNFRDMYWTLAQMVAHHTVNGCNLQPGDLLGSGTVSGTARDSRGSLLELTWDGDPFANPPVLVPGTQRTPLKLPTGEERKFLADGDEVIMKAYCEREGFRRIGFGECRGIITPAPAI